MNSLSGSCGCGCSPCVCTTSTTVGCIADLCVPRPCFFSGQLIGADDLNAVVAYSRTKEALLARFVGGWGVLGGMRLGATPSAQGNAALSNPLQPQDLATYAPNPQIVVGTVAQISAGVGIDAAGRTLALCSPLTVDLSTLVTQQTPATTQSCYEWFYPVGSPQCDSETSFQEDNAAISKAFLNNAITANAYWLVAQYIETPARPSPQYTGGGACDPAPSCNYSRRIEGVKLSLVPSLPSSYFLTGCLDALALPSWASSFIPTPPSTTSSSGNASNASFAAAMANRQASTLQKAAALRSSAALQTVTPAQNVSMCLSDGYAAVDAINAIVAGACCSTPALVLGQVLFTSNPGALQGNLQNAAIYTIFLDGYPFRRVVSSAAIDLFALFQMSCQRQNNDDASRVATADVKQATPATPAPATPAPATPAPAAAPATPAK